MTTEPTSTATPTAPAKPAVSTVSTVEKDITWIRGHVFAVLLAVALIAGSIIGGISLFESLIEKHDARVAAAQLQKEGVDTATQQALMNQLAQEHADDVTRDAQQTALITSLVQQMAVQRAQTIKQVATDAALDATSTAARLVTQTKSSPSDVTVNGNFLTMDLNLSHAVISDLDLLTQAQSDVTNLTGQLDAQTILTTDAKTELATANNIIAADKTELVAAVKADNSACQVRVDAEAAKGRKRTFWGIVGGFLGAALLFGK